MDRHSARNKASHAPGLYEAGTESYRAPMPRAIEATIEHLESRLLFAAGAQTYYVSPSGNDANMGTSPSQAWASIAAINAASFHAGDSILFQGGATFAGTIDFESDDVGTSANPINVGSFGSGRATITAQGGSGITIHDTSGFDISNLNIVGGGAGVNGGSGISLRNDLAGSARLPHVHIDQADIGGFGFVGIEIAGTSAGAGFSDVRVTHANIHDNDTAGIFSYAGVYNSSPPAFGFAHAQIYIGHVTLFNNRGHAGNNVSGSGVRLANVDGAVVERSVAHDNGQLNNGYGGGPTGFWAYNANHVTFQYNESFNNQAAHKDGGGFDLDGGTSNSIVQYNYSHDNAGAGYMFAEFNAAHPFAHNVIRYNISQNDGRKNGYPAIEIWCASSSNPIADSEITGNTVFVSKPSASTTAALAISSATKNLHVRNNIFFTTGGQNPVIVKNAGSGLLFQGNDYWTGSTSAIYVSWLGTTYQTLAAMRAATGQEKLGAAAVGLAVDPMLVSPGGGAAMNNADLLPTLRAYQLKSGSPMIDAGVNLNSLGANAGQRDFYGDLVPQGNAFDIGADEFVFPSTVTGRLSNADIGNATPAGRTTIVSEASAYDVSGGGTNVGGVSDQCRFVYEQFTGDFDVKVRIAALAGANSWSKAGLMVRGSLAANAQELFAFAAASAGVNGLTVRGDTGSTTSQAVAGSPKYPNAWLRLKRTGNTFTAWFGADGASWTQIGGTVTATMPSTVFLGLAVTSRVNTALATAQFRDLSGI